MKKLLMLSCLFLLLTACNNTTKPEEETPEIQTPSEEETTEDVSVSCLAVGDNLIHGAVYLDPYHVSGNTRDYSSIYENTNYLTQNVDIANINQETVLGGTELGLKSYPTFNSPHEIGDAIVNAGFDWISQASNHAFDEGEAGVISAMNFWDKYPEVVTTGLNRSIEEQNKARVIERNGIKFGLLNYTYGLNGFYEPKDKDYLVNDIDKDKMKSDIIGLQETCDIVMVSIHMGVEYQFQQNAEQEEMFQYLSDLGVDVILGSHPHVIEPVTFITGKDGNKTLAVYSLGNFLSAQDEPERMLGGMLKWNFVKDGKTGDISIQDAQYYPTVTYFQPHFVNFKTYVLKDFTDELAASHGLPTTRQFYVDLTNKVIGQPEGIEVIY